MGLLSAGDFPLFPLDGALPQRPSQVSMRGHRPQPFLRSLLRRHRSQSFIPPQIQRHVIKARRVDRGPSLVQSLRHCGQPFACGGAHRDTVRASSILCKIMDGRPPTECACGSQNFERIIVDRPGREPYRTDFLACVECRVMYFSPEPRVTFAASPWVDRMRRDASSLGE